MGTKGARLTSFVSLPGRHLVYTPTSNHIGISRRIESAQERQRLRAAVGELRPDQGGFIVRTVCEGVSKREIQRDVSFLTKLWSSVVKQSETTPPASLLSRDLDVALRVVRDLFSSDVDRLWCDDPETYERIVEFVQSYMPRLPESHRALRGRGADLRPFPVSSRRSTARSNARSGSSRAAIWSSIRPRRSPQSTSTPAASSASAIRTRRCSRPTSRRPTRSSASSACATSAASSSSTSST